MTEPSIRFPLAFDADLTRAALLLPLRATPSRPNWQKMLAALGSGALIGGSSIVILRQGFNLNHAFALFLSACIGATIILIFWAMIANRTTNAILERLAILDAAEGPTEITIDAQGVALASRNAQSKLSWPVFTSIDPLPGGTALLFGASRLVVPDHCLPDGMDGVAFRAQLQKWKSAHA